jgi:hypothetical protein
MAERGYSIVKALRLLPLAALPRMLAQIAAKLPTVGPAERARLRQRAELLRGLLHSAAMAPSVLT